MINYGFQKRLKLDFDRALEAVTEKLKQEGFGILTEIDVSQTLKKKLDVEFPRYKILGACNPPFAYKALQAETAIGLLMPCNAIVYEKDGGTYFAMVKPSATMRAVGNPALEPLAVEIEKKIERIFESLE